MKKKSVIFLVLVVLIISCRDTHKEQKRMNVLFIIADDLTTTAVSCQNPKALLK